MKDITIAPIKKIHMEQVIDLLNSNLSNYCPDESEYHSIWCAFSNQSHVYSLVATTNETVIGYGSISFELKIRGGKMGHIEDIVTHEDYRNLGLGRKILTALHDHAKILECYKVSLACKEHNTAFYEKVQYQNSGHSMTYFIS